MRRFGPLILAACAAAMPGPADADLEVDLDLVTTMLDDDGRPVDDPSEREALRVTLGAESFTIEPREGGGPSTAYDLGGRRILRIDREAGTYTEMSLFGEVGFRAAEFQNRLELRDVLEAGLDVAGARQQAVASFAPTLLEHRFSIDAPDLGGPIERRDEGGVATFSWDGRTLLTFEGEVAESGRASAEGFATFLRYRAGGHPEALDAIGSLGNIPARVRVVLRDVESLERTFEVRSVREVPTAPIALEGLTLVSTFGEARPLDDRIGRALEELPDEADRRAAEIAERTRTAADRDEAIPAMLGFLEHQLQTGTPVPNLDVAAIRRLAAEEDVRRILQSLQPPDAESGRAALETLETLGDAEGDSRHVLKIFRANIHGNFGELDEAEDLFLDALDENPFLAGAWKDLGDIYYRRFAMPDAWRCWDLGRRINPDFPTFEMIDDRERSLRERLPDYFAMKRPAQP